MTVPDHVRRAALACLLERRPTKPRQAGERVTAVPAAVAGGRSGARTTDQPSRIEIPFVRKAPRP